MIEILEHSEAAKSIRVTGAPAHPAVVSLGRRRVPIVLIALTVVATMAYTLLWEPVVGHHSLWIVPGDLWGTFRTSQFVAWGDIGNVYSSGGGLVSLPGISVALAPAAFLVNHLGLSIGFPIAIAHPTDWLVLGPYAAVLGSIVLIPLDALAEELGLGRGARLASSISEAMVLWPLLAIWGHPEDSVALAFALWGLMAAMRGSWRATGWFWGLALVMQPLVVLMLPIAVALAPRRKWPKFAVRAVLPSAVLVAIPLAQSWRQTTMALLKQPNYPTIDHATPWLALAPVLSKSHPVAAGDIHESTLSSGGAHFSVSVVHSIYGETVAAGPGRLIAIGLSLLLGIWVYRHRPTPETIVWLCCVALSLRCVFEAVMNPYYLWPPLALAFVLVVRSRWRFALAVVASGGLTWWSYRHLGPWDWWAPVVILLGLVVISARPERAAPDTAAAHAEWRGADSSRCAIKALV
jgi:hypothetical protein